MRLDVVEHPEVDEREASGCTPLDLGDGAVPGLEVELRRWARWHDETASLEADAGGVARVERAVRVQVRHVVPCVAGSREAVEPDDAIADDVDVRLGTGASSPHRLVERVAVEPPGARVELRRVDEVRRADLGDVDMQRRDARGRALLRPPHGRGGCGREEDGERRSARGPRSARPCLQRRNAARRPAVEERRPVLRLQQVAGDDPRRLVVEVDRPSGHTGDPRGAGRGIRPAS